MAKSVTVGSSAYIAQRLRAHARLCLQVAVESRSEQTARDLARLADLCRLTANELEPPSPAAGLCRYH